mmetsp:Transcript_4903/g.17503  ORF Transcript_4903/g.17503 Transcript_4903/m.17503 type:complete len:296 (-) Transcript_4903:948-1835(-)
MQNKVDIVALEKDCEARDKELERQGSDLAMAKAKVTRLRQRHKASVLDGARNKSTPQTSSTTYTKVAENAFGEDRQLELEEMLTDLQPQANPRPMPADFCAYERLKKAFKQPENILQKAMKEELKKVTFDDGRFVEDTSNAGGQGEPDFTLYYGTYDLTAALLFIELKAWSGEHCAFKNASYGQVASYCTLLLSKCKWKARCYGVLLNGASLVLVRCTRLEHKRGYLHERSAPVPFLRLPPVSSRAPLLSLCLLFVTSIPASRLPLSSISLCPVPSPLSPSPLPSPLSPSEPARD